MLVIDQDEIVGWLDQRVDPRADTIALFSPRMDWDDLLSSGAEMLSAQTDVVHVPVERLAFRHMLDDFMLERLSLEARQFSLEGADVARLVRLLAGRGVLPRRAVILVDMPEHTQISVARDEMRLCQILYVDTRVLAPSAEVLEKIFDLDEFYPLDEADYRMGDLDRLIRGNRNPTPGSSNGGVPSQLHMPIPHTFGMRVRHPGHRIINSLS